MERVPRTRISQLFVGYTGIGGGGVGGERGERSRSRLEEESGRIRYN